jgi:hypothetical protein
MIGRVLATLVGLAFILFGGCSLFSLGVALFGGGRVGDTLAFGGPFVILGALAAWGGVRIIRRAWRRR